jgi:type III restriction enzyme
MIERIKFIQENKVDELLALTNVEGEKDYTLKAPTGSGKTYMEGYLISKLLNQYPNAIVIYQSLSKAGLANQAYDKIINQYQFNNINAYLINADYSNQERPTVPLNYNAYFLPKDLFKSGGNIEIAFKNFLTYENNDKTKFLILDEGHIASNNIGKYADEFDRIFVFTATPLKEQMLPGRFVELDEDVCIQENIIKSKKEIHQNELELSLNKRLITTLKD